MDDVYTKKNYTNQWKRKRNDYTIKYNTKMNNNIELKTINVKKRRKLHILQKEVIHDTKLLQSMKFKCYFNIRNVLCYFLKMNKYF